MGLWGEDYNPRPSNATEYDVDKIAELVTSRDFKIASVELIKRWLNLTQLFKIKFPDKDLVVICTYRNPDVQKKLYRVGRSIKGIPLVAGSASALNQIPSRALHAIVTNLGLMEWDEVAYYPLGAMAKEVGLQWAGLNVEAPDYTYFSLPSDVR